MKHKDKILKLRADGKSYRQIQDIVGCSKGTIAYHLGDGQKQKTLERSNIMKAKRRRETWVIKENSGCFDCKEMYPHYVLEFDHLPEFEKMGSVSEIYSRDGRQAGLREAEKCDVVCANCHKIRTYNRAQQGTRSMPTNEV
jgi:NAD-dependent dihydropyrimidine dehydrogenase PreA subunit